MNKYVYDGPVKEFDDVVSERWHGETMAVSEKKAKSNLAYQFKKKTNRTSDVKITLPGKLTMVE